MALDIELFAQLLPGQPRRQELEVRGDATVLDIAHSIGLDEKEVGLVTVDGVQSKLGDRVKPDSRICFFPYLAGG